MTSRLRLAFYGDDFTGSTDALEVLAYAGLRTALFLKPPTPAMVARFGDLDAIGVAGDSRAMTPAEMDAHLPEVFDRLAALGAPLLHYKVCSTFDSAPGIGSIGCVMEIARARFTAPWLPIVASTPRLGRWCLFGNLYARSGTDGQVYRIDRHPIMRVHPVTPMDEADLRVHLGRQGSVPVGSLPLDRLDAGTDAMETHLTQLRADGTVAVVLDAAHDAHMTQLGDMLERHGQAAAAAGRGPLFIVGSSGAQYALTQHWKAAPGAREAPAYPLATGVTQLLAVSGSASRLSALQITAALEAGFAELPVDAAALVGPQGAGAAADLTARACALLREGRSVLLHTARGPDDPRITAMITALQAGGATAAEARHEGGRRLGQQLGEVVARILEAVPLPRLLVSGGDTSSQVTQALGPDALQVAARLAPGAPLCRMAAPGRHLDGMEVALKGGQMGGTDYFVRAWRGA